MSAFLLLAAGSIFSVEALLALLALTLLEIVLGIDNIVFIAILAGRLPEHERKRAWRLGLLAAMIMRIALLLVIQWIARLDTPFLEFNLLGRDFAFSWRSVILLAGGLFLIWKSVHEIHAKLEGPEPEVKARGRANTLFGVIAQIMVIDLVSSLDSVITAVGVAKHLPIMIAAIVISIGVMMIFARQIGEFIQRHPTMKMLAISFLLLIGVLLTAEGFGVHISKGYIYFAMAFALGVELLNLRARKVAEPVPLHIPRLPSTDT